jgi:hypothetical protein
MPLLFKAVIRASMARSLLRGYDPKWLERSGKMTANRIPCYLMFKKLPSFSCLYGGFWVALQVHKELHS